jgi:hypothetical protein
MRDSQQSKLYKVERIWYNAYENCSPKDLNFTDERQASNYGTWIWINFKNKIYPQSWRTQVPRVRVEFKNRGGWSYAMNSNGWYNDRKTGAKYKWVRLSPFHRNFHILIHEMAHHLVPKYNNNGDRTESHGQEFTKILMLLLAHYLDYDIGYMCKVANEHNLKYSCDDLYVNKKFNQLVQKNIKKEADKLSA